MNPSLLRAAFAAPRGLAALVCVTSAVAQETKKTEETKQPVELHALEKVEVTGSLIKRTDIEGPSPVRMITREEIELTGFDNLTDIIREIPESTPLDINEGGTTSFVRGASAIDLRSLGPNNTLVLVDGRRQAPNGISGGSGTVFVDLNRIPVSLIERVELLKDGASAVYGSDATAGVINIITRQNFVGAEVTARYGNYFNTDGGELSVSVFGGTRAGKLRANVNYSYTSRNANAAIDQPFSANSAGVHVSVARSRTAHRQHFQQVARLSRGNSRRVAGALRLELRLGVHEERVERSHDERDEREPRARRARENDARCAEHFRRAHLQERSGDD